MICKECNGSGEIAGFLCHECGGSGYLTVIRCTECGKECNAIEETFDYSGTHCTFGMSGTHHTGHYVSDCCSAEVRRTLGGITNEAKKPEK